MEGYRLSIHTPHPSDTVRQYVAETFAATEPRLNPAQQQLIQVYTLARVFLEGAAGVVEGTIPPQKVTDIFDEGSMQKAKDHITPLQGRELRNPRTMDDAAKARANALGELRLQPEMRTEVTYVLGTAIDTLFINDARKRAKFEEFYIHTNRTLPDMLRSLIQGGDAYDHLRNEARAIFPTIARPDIDSAFLLEAFLSAFQNSGELSLEMVMVGALAELMPHILEDHGLNPELMKAVTDFGLINQYGNRLPTALDFYNSLMQQVINLMQ